MDNVLIVALILIGIALVVREFWCWYWKINAAVDELRAIRALLQRQIPAPAPPSLGGERKTIPKAIPGGGV